MGSYFEIRLGAQTPGGAELAERVLDLIDALEAQLTVYRPESEVSQLNASAHLGPAEVEGGLFRLLSRAMAIGSATKGAYDVTTGALSEAWGFFRGPKRVPNPEALAEARARTGQHHLHLESTHRTVSFDRPGVVINLGSIGKGYAIDRASELIAQHWWPDVGLDSRGTLEPLRPWVRPRAVSPVAGRLWFGTPSLPTFRYEFFGSGIGGWGHLAPRFRTSSTKDAFTGTSLIPEPESRR